MIAVNSGLGYLIIDARNAGKRYDLVVAGMVLIGFIGWLLDLLMRQVGRFPALKWAYGTRHEGAARPAGAGKPGAARRRRPRPVGDLPRQAGGGEGPRPGAGRPRSPAGGVRLPGRALGVRQDDLAERARRVPARHARRGAGGGGAGPRPRPAAGLHLPGGGRLPLADRRGERRLRAAAQGRGGTPAGRAALPGHGGSGRLRARLPAGAVGGDAPARRDRPRPGRRAGGPVHGRAVRRWITSPASRCAPTWCGSGSRRRRRSCS
jgi:hypothetical protein